ncbi:hypothetical protein BB559_001960 [Furculomyces boomerangus]|uniref:Polynucleotide kinase 3'-phosphatase n=2 Tax=Harpellales TaxID=61421 RepID=A0A2T9YZ31_9FUNG|nr:hypothetical protein BB559_001960 [Furculomyces boomerangus]PVZ98217.1 hypothetical protein BB558_005769 [Smittium angustum]
MPPKKRQLSLTSFTKNNKRQETGNNNSIENKDSYPGSWFESHNLLIGKFGDPQTSSKIAAFDLDGTLINVKSKYKTPQDGDDWVFAFPIVVDKLRKLYSEGFHISLVSNQKGLLVEKGKKDLKKQKRIQDMKHKLQIPFWFFAAKEEDFFRKPRIGIWYLVAIHANKGEKIDLDSSFYVGDALGRPAGWRQGVSKDHSDCDLKLAYNIGIKIYSPEEFFESKIKPPKIVDPVHPRDLTSLISEKKKEYDGYENDLIENINQAKKDNKQVVVIMIGMPASGKSTFVLDTLVEKCGFTRVNQDTLVTKKKCLDFAAQSLKEGKNIVIDNTNPGPDPRSEFISLAKSFNTLIYCAHKDVPDQVVSHNNSFRAVYKQAIAIDNWVKFESSYCYPNPDLINKPLEELVELVPDPGNKVSRIVYNVYKNKFVLPTKNEGFHGIYLIPFSANNNSDLESKIWNLHLS